jgi:hypothetical protein
VKCREKTNMGPTIRSDEAPMYKFSNGEKEKNIVGKNSSKWH